MGNPRSVKQKFPVNKYHVNLNKINKEQLNTTQSGPKK